MDEEIKKKFISDLQAQAASIKSFEKTKPLFIEFSGTPKSGKTTALKNLDLFLRRNGFKVSIIRERAEHCPIPPKNHIYFNTWTFCETLSNMLESFHSDSDVVLIDRGVFDSFIWFTWMKNTGRIDNLEMMTLENFLLLQRWKKLLDVIFLFKSSFAVSLKREYQDLLTDIPGPIMNENVINQFNQALDEVYDKYKNKFAFLNIVDTSNTDIITTGKKITSLTLESLKMVLDERIGIIKRNMVEKYLKPEMLIDINSAEIVELAHSLEYKCRSEAEEMDDCVQLIPCAAAILK